MKKLWFILGSMLVLPTLHAETILDTSHSTTTQGINTAPGTTSSVQSGTKINNQADTQVLESISAPQENGSMGQSNGTQPAGSGIDTGASTDPVTPSSTTTPTDPGTSLNSDSNTDQGVGTDNSNSGGTSSLPDSSPPNTTGGTNTGSGTTESNSMGTTGGTGGISN